jgi:membrane protease YdiL (CAAX protease family)
VSELQTRLTQWPAWVQRVVSPALIEQVPRDHAQSDRDFLRRRIVVIIGLALGATLLGFSLAVRPGDTAFYPLTLAVAAVWIVAGLLSGPLHLGYVAARGSLRRPVLVPIALGLLAGAVFVVGSLIVREIDPLRDYVDEILDHARKGSLILITVVTLVNGLAEEVFFRGALFAAIGRRHPVLISTGIYALTTIVTGNPMLVFSAALLGLLLGLQRRASGGILGPMLMHVTWSATLLFVLPPLYAR